MAKTRGLKKQDLDEFKLSVKNEAVDNYVIKSLNTYKSEGIDTKEKLYSRLLKVAILQEDESGVDLILDQTFNHKDNILTFSDEIEWSIICHALNTSSRDIFDKIQDYIASHEDDFNKPDLDKSYFKLFKNIILTPEVSETPITLLDECLRPLYSEKSIEELISFIGQDTLDGYYL